MKIFSLRGDVQGVGFRLVLIDLAFRHNIRVYPTNVEGGNQVDVLILDGKDEDIRKYHKLVKDADMRLDKRGDMYEVTEIKEYNGPAPDWTYEMMGFMVEQLKMGAEQYFLMKTVLEKILKRLDKPSD